MHYLPALCPKLTATFSEPRNWVAAGQLPEEIRPECVHLDFWMPKFFKHKHEQLLAQATGRDLVRLQCQNAPNIGAWLSVVPSAALGLEFCSSAFRLLLRWWLGGELVNNTNEDTPVCPFCQGPCDVYGDHFLCCKKYEFHSRHEAVVSMTSHFLRAAGMRF